jgi:hypothetical protein
MQRTGRWGICGPSLASAAAAAPSGATDMSSRVTSSTLYVAALIVVVGAAARVGTDAPTAASQVPPVQTPAPSSAPADALTFGPGRHRIGETVQAGRYFSDPGSGCYWERQSGTSGNASDTTAFGFVGADAAQAVVDIALTDAAFEANAACGTWSSQPRPHAAGTIAPGAWLVGTQLPPGTYRADAAAGCYWERLRDFLGTTGSVIASELVETARPAFATLLPGDIGFSSHPACGTWIQISGLDTVPVAPPRLRTLPSSDINHP